MTELGHTMHTHVNEEKKPKWAKLSTPEPLGSTEDGGGGRERAVPSTEASPDLSLCGFALYIQAGIPTEGGVRGITLKRLGIKLGTSGDAHWALSLLGSPLTMLPLGADKAKVTPPSVSYLDCNLFSHWLLNPAG